MSASTVLVTGASGFLAAHLVFALLEAGHTVRCTVRNADREADTLNLLRAGGLGEDALARATFVVADLERDEGWAEAVFECDGVFHVASPFPIEAPKDDQQLIAPARDGTLRVLRAARDAGVRRVVLTSSFAAIGYGHPPRTQPFTEQDWTQLQADVPAYVKSKTLAERAAWDFIAAEGGGLELVAINPVAVFGPVLGADYSSSITLIKRLIDGVPGCPRIHTGVVDVRDVVDLHVRAMTHPAAVGERFIAAAGQGLSILEIAGILRARLGPAARKVPTRQLPDWAVKLAAVGEPALRQVLPQLGVVKIASAEKAWRVLGWRPMSPQEAIIATVDSLLRFGLV